MAMSKENLPKNNNYGTGNMTIKKQKQKLLGH